MNFDEFYALQLGDRENVVRELCKSGDYNTLFYLYQSYSDLIDDVRLDDLFEDTCSDYFGVESVEFLYSGLAAFMPGKNKLTYVMRRKPDTEVK